MDIVKDNQMYMRIAQIAAERSYAKRLKVGCVIVKNHFWMERYADGVRQLL